MESVKLRASVTIAFAIVSSTAFLPLLIQTISDIMYLKDYLSALGNLKYLSNTDEVYDFIISKNNYLITILINHFTAS